jgi:hypothetical protein
MDFWGNAITTHGRYENVTAFGLLQDDPWLTGCFEHTYSDPEKASLFFEREQRSSTGRFERQLLELGSWLISNPENVEYRPGDRGAIFSIQD